MVKKKRILLQSIILIVTLLAFTGYLAIRQINMDSVGPEITVDTAPLELSVNDPQDAYLQGISAHDNKDGDVTDRILVESVYGLTKDHHVTVTYAAFDAAGNVTKAQRQAWLSDYHSPRFTMDCAMTFSDNANVDIMEHIGAEDVIDGDIAPRVRATLISNTGSLLDAGVHDLQLRVTNSIGDSVELILPVEVYAAGKYNAQMELEQYILYLPKGAAFHAKSYPMTFTYSGQTIVLTANTPGIDISVSGYVDTQTPGVYPVAYTATYTNNQAIYKAYSKMFVIVEE